jgi:trimeric autotransporter adhesin
VFTNWVISPDLRQHLSSCSVSLSGVGRKPLRWRGATYARAIRALLLLAAVSTVGCSGGSSSSGSTGGTGSSATPQISNLTFPNSIAESSNGTVTVNGTLNFTDNGSGLATLIVTVFDANGQQISTFSNAITGLGGQTSGTLSATFVVTVTQTGTYTFRISVTDGNGSKSNELTGIIQVVYPVPVLQSIIPTSIPVNSPDTVVSIRGTGILAASTMEVNGGNPISLTAANPPAGPFLFTIPASNFTTVGQLSITVSNPGTAASNALLMNVTPNPVPTLSFVSPVGAPIGGGDFTLTVTGSSFVPSSIVQWNGSARPTTYVSAAQLEATISAKDIQTLGNDMVSVFTSPPGGGTSPAQIFTTFITLSATDLAYSSATQMLYASVPSSGGAVLGNSIVPIDPNTGVIGTPIFVGSEPTKMAMSSDGTVIWVALNGAGAVRKVDLIAQTAGLQFSLGSTPGLSNPVNTAQALAVMPNSPNTVAVCSCVPGLPSNSVTIYDNGIARTNTQNQTANGLAFDATGTKLYGAGSSYWAANVDSSGIGAATTLNANVSSNSLSIDGGRAYLTSGVVLDATTGAQVGVFSVGPYQNAIGPVAPDSGVGAAFVFPSFSSTALQVNAYDISTFNLKGTLTTRNFSSNPPPFGFPSLLVRWGQDGLAFSNGAQLYIFHSPLVRDLSSSRADLSVTASAPGSVTTGTNIAYMLTVNNAGPQTATPATLIDDLPNGAALQSATASQGSCSGTTIVWCDLGSLNSSGSATVQIIATALSPGTLSNTALVSAPQGDPNPANNTVTSTTSASGAAFSPKPVVSSISPAFVQSGSASFKLTVNGSGFVSGSQIELNSIALMTTFVSGSQLSASVPASDVASLGWAWINVVNPNPLPGGGSSGSLPLTMYGVISLDVNHMGFDPFTRKLYASVPSTATQVTGNSLVGIDPLSGAVGTPLNIGSEPNRMAESTDGQYLYVGLDGSKSVARVNLSSMTRGPVFPIFAQNTQVTARDLAVTPGNDNLLAIDTGASSGDGLYDIDATTATATLRGSVTGPSTGSNLVFRDGSTLYSYDTDTSLAEFNRWSVTSTGLTRLTGDTTGYTLNGIGEFNGGFRLGSSLVYGFAGGVADPTPTPPVLLGQFAVPSALGSGQTVEGTGVAPDPALGRVFILGETLAGSANPVLFSYDSNRYVLMSMQQFTGMPSGSDVLRWGRDGLAWHTSFGFPFGGSVGTGKIILMRGPFVLPTWNTVNATPTLSSVTPSSATAGSGNMILTITGSGFVPGAVVTWNGAERTTTFVDSSDLTVAIPASDLSQSSTATLTVNNPGSADSTSISFAIN